MNTAPPHRVIQPSVLYFGTPVALVTTSQPDGTANISPISSAWALGDRLVLGLGQDGQCLANLLRTREAVVNLPSDSLVAQVERIARTTGRSPVPPKKLAMDYTFEPDKFRRAGLTALPSEQIAPPRIAECPLQLEAVLLSARPSTPSLRTPSPTHSVVELEVVRVHAHRTVTIEGTQHVDVSQWRPLFYVFRHYFGLGIALGKNFRAETPCP